MQSKNQSSQLLTSANKTNYQLVLPTQSQKPVKEIKVSLTNANQSFTRTIRLKQSRGGYQGL